MEYISDLIAPLVFILVGFLMFFIGFYIKSSKKIEIINQVDRKKRYDRDGLSNFAGNNAIIMGSSVMIIGAFDIIGFLQTKNMTIHFLQNTRPNAG